MKKHGLSGGELDVEELTWREQEILTLLSDRLTNREIGARLHLAESTVKDYVGNILSKLYVKNRREAVARAKDLGLLGRETRALVQPATNLPAEATQFIGRRDELEQIKRYLGETRLLTLTGPGGIGKTRLALKAAREADTAFKDGSFFVALAPIQSSEHIIQTIAESLRFPIATHEDPQYQLLRYLRKRKLLLVMDNFEHLLEGVGIVSEIIQSAPGVTILATSRERLNLQSETVLNIRGMLYPYQRGSTDIMDYDAVNLFIQRARKVRPGFDPAQDELEQVIHICQMIQGMPIAIELAAAWLQILNLDDIAGELEKGLDILTTEMRDAPERHRSIRVIFDHSWFLLDQTERQIFTRLSVFRGGFSRQAAQQVSGATLKLLAGLVDKSFLNYDPNSGRFEVHELLRQYALEQLEKHAEIMVSSQEAHAAYYALFMQQVWVDLRCQRQIRALAEVEADIENVRAAWRYYLDQKNTPQLWKFIKGLWYLYYIRWWNHAGMSLFAEAIRALDGLKDDESIALSALAMAFQGFFMGWLDLAEEGYGLAANGVSILERLDHPESLVLAYFSMSLNAYFLNRYIDEIKTINTMVNIATERGDSWLLVFTLFASSFAALMQGDYEQARQLAESNLNFYEEIGDRIGASTPLIVLGDVAFAQFEYSEARSFYLRSLDMAQESGFYYAIQTATKYLSKAALSLNEIAEAEKYLRQCLTITREIGFVRDIINLFYEFARLRQAHGKLEEAVELLALVMEHPTSQQYRMLEGRIADSAEQLLSQTKEDLPPDVYHAALARGKSLVVDAVIEDLLAPQG